MKLAGAAGLVASCFVAVDLVHAQPPLAYLHTFGPAANPGTRLGWGLGIVSIAVLTIITVLLLGAIFRRRVRSADSQTLAVQSDSGGMPWLYVGVGLSTLVVIGCAVWTMVTIAAQAMPSATGSLTLQVTAAQWWWSVRYSGARSAPVFNVANEIHIPVGQPIRIELSSQDVIHSFWVPHLAGKTDVIPGQTNVMWVQASAPGIYRGQCGEFCGAQHAHMAMYVVADLPRDYLAWEQGQLREAQVPAAGPGARGENVFLARCAACHTVRGTEAGGTLGPDLTHLMSRKTIGAGLLPNTRGDLTAWVANAQALKPGARMPTLELNPEELSAVVAYLETLQ